MADKIRARWPLYATLTVALLIVVGVGFVMAGGPEKQVASLTGTLTGDEIAVLEAARSDAQRVVDRIDEVLSRRVTTTAGRTTSTVASSTTVRTTVPATTTTLPGGTPEGERWLMTFKNGSTIPHTLWWTATYFRSLPYAPNTGWTADGDRDGYRCAYGFLTSGAYITAANPEGIVGRVTFIRVEGASYSTMVDKFLADGSRYYDGPLAPEDAPHELGDCPQSTTPYEPSSGPWQLPTITYETRAGKVLEIRDYKATVTSPGITFRQVDASDSRVTVVAYENGLPVIVVYYDAMLPKIVMGTDFDQPGG